MGEKKIFVSYRRDDSAGHAGRLCDHLANHFGAERVFQDIDAINFGDDFLDTINRALSECDVLIVIIGKQWSAITDARGRRRLDNPEDVMRLELETALARGLRVIPVLVQGAAMPSSEELPPPLARLARRHAIEVSDSRFQYDAGRLVASIENTRRELAAQELAPGAGAPRASNRSFRPEPPGSKSPRPAQQAPGRERIRPPGGEPVRRYWALTCITLAVSLFCLLEVVFAGAFFLRYGGRLRSISSSPQFLLILSLSLWACVVSRAAYKQSMRAKAAFAKDDAVGAGDAGRKARRSSLHALVSASGVLVLFFLGAWMAGVWPRVHVLPSVVHASSFWGAFLIAFVLWLRGLRWGKHVRRREPAGARPGAGYRDRAVT
jgi:hypothetical protein